MTLQGKKILLGVCGSIAAFKAVILVRQLVKQGAMVRVIMTPDAAAFVAPLTFSTLSKNEVYIHFYEKGEQVWHNHVELGLWADLLLIAPATANTMAKLANGLCDNLLCATYLSARCPVYIAPAMDLDMWQHPATRRNINLLQAAGNHMLSVGTGELASGLWGEGRLAEPETILQHLVAFFTTAPLPLAGKQVLITAGPTYEPIDPVRFIGNRSSGKMGLALAETALQMGASVCLVLGTNSLSINPHPKLTVIPVETAEQMFAATVTHFAAAHIAILAAAVSDYTPAQTHPVKIKKTEQDLTLTLRKTKDILAYLGTVKQPHQILVGFALETNNEQENAQQKLVKKNLDFIVLNSLQNPGAGFQHTTNQVSILNKENNWTHYPLLSKQETAAHILQTITAAYQNQQP
ncbi:MAG TPA: bifunctional phosphopantothenoylcysteine decarboxylase/phosphopantothenate--cysteine ligase CoaBC [Chitinophagales bacterium]|nr:bifunctional phosphopantothenoylcysteine decarboxylase/phosphopantothenate--cysteine ligase CoaBC [Chitinophagales bacterium]HRK25921.1 bifunctional phosphopantothenoylcysteine decarboxylase/phosphopantothenate--cysteine ligase CoaBC [Chitinophagales bacterium]